MKKYGDSFIFLRALTGLKAPNSYKIFAEKEEFFFDR